MANDPYPVSFRRKFIQAWLASKTTFGELCARFGISRETGYEWRSRYEYAGLAGLEPRSSAPESRPHATPPELEELIVKARKAHPHWGPRKLLVTLSEEHPDEPFPAASTVGEILKAAGMVQPRKRRRRQATPSMRPFAACKAPNDVWTIDFKGQFRTGDGRLCYPLTLADAFSRYLLRCDGYARPTYEVVRRSCEAAFREFGLPRVIHSDNGTPFSSTSAGGVTRLNVWWIRLGIIPQRITPGRPAENGRHERMHRTLKRDTMLPVRKNLRAQHRAFQRFRRDYNDLRPHEALGQTPPARSYTPSCRPYPRKLPEIEYPASYELRKVRPRGDIKWRGGRVFVSESLHGEVVGAVRVSEDTWELYFGPVLLGILSDERPELGLLRPGRRQ